MKKILIAILLVQVGFLAGTTLYSYVFDPLEFLEIANKEAKFSYLSGCLEGKTNALKEKPFDYERRYCEFKAEELYQKLETLRKQ
jgi:hypothetical protein